MAQALNEINLFSGDSIVDNTKGDNSIIKLKW